ncbi:MAG: DUF4349 domain-containing protein, partial [Desulfitobacteriaceae bacterium]
GQIKLFDNQVDFSTISLQLVPVANPNLKVTDPWQPVAWSKTWRSIQDAFLKTISGTWNILNYGLVGLGYISPYVTVLVLVWLAYRFWLRWRHKE